jgi:hypothetical protein
VAYRNLSSFARAAHRQRQIDLLSEAMRIAACENAIETISFATEEADRYLMAVEVTIMRHPNFVQIVPFWPDPRQPD